MISFRKAIRFCSLVLTLGVPFAASAATFDVKTLIDTDNNRGTGCNVVTPSGIVSGIDVMITTAGTVTGSTGTVTAVTRQTCVNPVLNQFSSPVAVDGGWNVGVSTAGATAGDVFVESHMGLDVLTMDNIGTPRFVFTSSSGLSFDVLLTPWSWGGGDIVMPHAARDRAMTPLAQRNIVLDGLNPDWAGNVPLANGTASPPVWRFISAGAYAGLHDLFFNFHIHTNGAAPTAHDDNYSLNTLGGTLTVATLGVLNNDNPNNQPITASLVDGTQHGTLALAPNGGFTYIHDGSLASQDQFHYVAVGTSLVSNVATVTIDLPGTHPYTFTSPNAVTFTAGQFNTFLVTVTGKPTPALSEEGGLPSGVTFVDNGNGTGTLSGTPAANSVAVYPIVFNAEKNKPHQTSQDFTLTVVCGTITPTITTSPSVCANSTGNTASGSAATTWAWSITNGTITSAANIQNITYTAGASGAVGLTLTVSDASCQATSTRNVPINPTPSATITTPPQVCASSTGNIASGPASMTTYAWSISNGTITSATNIQTITYTAGASGSVGLTLTVTNGSGCSATNSGSVPINPNPTTPAITPTPASVCGGSTGNTASGPAGATSYAWSITNGTITSATNIQTITYTAGASGSVGLTLVVSNGSCTASNTANVPINPSPATPTASNGGPYCPGATISLSTPAVGGATYSWTGPNGFTSSLQNPTRANATTADAGVYSVTVTVSGCTSAAGSTTVIVNPTPATPPAFNGGPYCVGATIALSTPTVGSATYSWTGPNGFTSSLQNPTRTNATTADAGVYSVTVTVNSCPSAAGTTNVVVNPIPATPPAFNGGPYCEGATISLSTPAVAGASYSWTGPNGFTSSLQNPTRANATLADAGTYSVTVTVNNCTSAAGTTNVVVNATPATPTPSNGGPYCEGATISLSTPAVGGATYAWTGPNGFTSSLQNPTRTNATLADAGTYSVTVTVSGCTSAAGTTNVVVNPIPATPAAGNGGPYCVGATISLSTPSVAGATYSWTGPNGFTSSLQNPTRTNATLADAGTYSVTVTVSGCTSAAGTTNVVVNANPATPSITTPASTCGNSTGNSASGPAGATSYAWSITNGAITSATNVQNITYTAGPSGTVGLTLTVTNASNCSATNTVNVTINPSPSTPAITTPAQVCANSTGNTADGPAGATSYAWSIVNGTITSATNIQTITYTAGASGTVDLTLVVTNGSGCPATNTVNVTINANPTTPAISPSPSSVCTNSTGNTAAGPAGATSYAWSIVNGTITSATNIQTITYSAGASGTVDLTLVVTNAAGCSASNTTNVTINPNPATPTITATPTSVCANSTGNTADGPVGATSYAWSIVNGTITSATNIQTITYTAGASGTVDLTLVVTNLSGCSASKTANVTIDPSPATPTITTPASTCANSTGNTASGPAGATSYAWSIVNGTITSATNIQTITYTAGASGTVGLTLVVTNASGCSATGTANVTINANPATPTITPTPAQVCANSTGNTAAGPAGATSYAWSITNGTITSATNIQTITYTAGASGTVGLTLVVTNASGCSATGTSNVTINANPATPAITTPASTCANSTGNSASGPAGATSYAWSITNGTITSATNIQTITYTAGASGSVGLTLVVTNASGCSASNTSNVTINANPATPAITTPASTCANSTGNSASGPAGATSYAWSIVNGTITSATNIQTITYTAGASGTVDLTLVVTNPSGCSASNTNNVIINANPATPTITTPANACANSTGNSASGPAGATSYAWSITNGTITSATNIQTITYTAGASGTVGLTLVVTNASGCSASNTSNVTINANPATPTITPSPAQVCANSTGNTASGPAGATSYAWSIVNGTITSATNIQTITYTAGPSGTVDLTLVVSNGAGCSASATNNVIINPNPAMPSITTPASTCANSTGNSASGPAGATSYAWSITNGTITSATNIQTITYTAGASGTVSLTLVVTNASGCSASNTANVTINANPATPSITTPASTCANSIGNSASGPAGATSYAWSITNGSITSATNIQTITYTAGASGTVGLTLVVTNPAGCSATGTANVTINANPATPAITTPASTCANSTGNSASGPAGATSYAWSITNGTITSATNIQTITYTAGASGTVGLTLVVTNASGCSATGTANVTINANPATPAITTPASTCANSTGNSASGPGGATSYAWSITNGTITSATNIQTITYTAGASGTVGLTLVVTNASGCSATGTSNVTINANPATPAITTPASTCANSVGNSASGPAGATSYAWSIVNGSITSATNIQTITYTAGASGTVGLTLVVTNASGCSATGTANVTINANPAAPVITPAPATLCPSSTGNTASGPAGATSYSWSIVNGTITSATNIQTITYTAGASGTTDLTLVVTNAAGCSATSTANVPNSNVAPSVTTHPLTQSVLVGTSVTFTAAASGTPTPTVQWQVSTGGPFSDISGETNTSLTFTTQLSQSGNQYRAVFTNACGTATTNAATLTVTCPTITVTRNPTNPFPNGVYNTAYSQSFTASGGTGPYTFAQTGGTFPTGLNLASNGAITGTPTATGVFNFNVTATDTATGCTSSSTAFAISIAPSAVNDSYGAANNIIDNVQFVITGGTTTSPATPFVGATGNILTNDSSDAPKTATAGTFATTGGGSVTIAADGTFIYTPGVHAAAITSDTFTYTVVSSGVSSTPATVTLTLANRVWFVKNSGAAGNGQSQNPFNTLAAAQTASAAGDTIFVYNGNNTTSGQTTGITLKNNQQLIGEGVALVVNTVTLVPVGTKPLIANTNPASDAVTLANGNTLKGINITGATGNDIAGTNTAGLTMDTMTIQGAGAASSGLVLSTPTGTVTITNTAISNSPFGLTINGGTAAFTMNNTNTISSNAGQRTINFANLGATAVVTIGAGITDNGIGMSIATSASGAQVSFTGTQTLGTTTNTAVSLTTNTGAIITFSGTLAITTSSGSGFVASGGGTLNVTGTANITTGAAASGLSLSGMTLTASGVTFNSVTTTGATTGVALTTLTGGTVTINGGTISGGTTGISLQGPATNLSLAGVTLTGSTTAIANTTNFGTLTIGASVNVSGVTALNLTTGALNGTFANLSSTGGTNGVVLTSIGGTGWTATTGSLFGSTGAAFKVDGGSANMTYGGAIRSTGFLVDIGATTGRSGGTITFSTGTIGGTGAQSGTGIRIQNSTGTSTFTFSGSQTLGNSGNRIASTAVTLALNNSTTVFNFSGTLAINSTGVTAFTATGPTGGTINFSGTDSIDAATGSALVLNGVALGTGTLSTVTSTGGVNGISLTTVTGGTLTISGGSLSGNTGAAFLVSAGSPTVSYAGTITQNTAGQRAVDLQTRTGGTITFSGLITSSGGAGVFMNNAAGGSTTVFSGGMTLSTGASPAFTATGGGVVNVSGTNNVTSTSGKGVDWATDTSSTGVTFNNVTSSTGAAVTIVSSGGSNFTFNDVTSTTGTAVTVTTATGAYVFHAINANGASNGVNVSAATGSFTVNGTGTTAGSGGTIQNCTANGLKFVTANNITLKNMNLTGNGTAQTVTGASANCGGDLQGGNNLSCVANLFIQTATTVSLDRLSVINSGQMGINGNAVNGLSITNCTITGNGNESSENGVTLQNTSGTLTVNNDTIRDNAARQMYVANIGAQVLTFNTTSTSYSRTVDGTSATGQGLLMDCLGTSSTTFTGTSLTFAHNQGLTQANALQINVNGSATMPTSSISNSSFDLQAAAIDITSGSNGNATFNSINNTIDHSAIQSILYGFLGAAGNGSLTGTIQLNKIGQTQGCLTAAAACAGISINSGNGWFGQMHLLVDQNTIQRVSGGLLVTIDGSAGTAPTAHIKMTKNTINTPTGGAADAALRVTAATTSGNPNLNGCWDVGGAALQNVIAGDWGVGGATTSIQFRQRFSGNGSWILPGYGGAAGDSAAVTTYVDGRNSVTPPSGGFTKVLVTNTTTPFANGSCVTP